MTLTSDQTARLSAAQIDIELRIYVTGPRRSVAADDFAAGQTYTAFPSTTTTAAVAEDDDTINVSSSSGFDDAGSFWLVGSGGALEMVEYGSKTGTTFTDLTRPNPQAFDSGDTVRQWTEITNSVTELQFDENLDDVLGTWVCQLRGINYDSRAMSQNNAVLVMARFSPAPSEGSGWSDWVIFCQGYFGPGTTDDDYRQGAEWTKPIRGIDMYMAKSDAPARRYGRANIALSGTASASTALADSSLIGHSGEVVGTQDVGASNLIDDSLSTVYCSSAIPQIVAGDTSFAGFNGVFISEVGWGPVGTGDDGAYFVIWNTGSQTISWNNIANRQTTIPIPESNNIPATTVIWTRDQPDLPSIPGQGRVIFCRDRETFESWAGPQDVEIVEWRKVPGASNFVLRQAGDKLSFVSNFGYGEFVQVRWGDEATGTAWEGLAAQGFGQALYRPDFSVDAGDDTDWSETNTPVPGRNGTADTQVYASVELDQLAITLASNHNASTTTITVSPGTTGLDQNGGTVQIDSEQIDYTAATDTQLTGCTRGVNGTTAATHIFGATIYAVDESDQAHLDERIGRIGWKRKRVLDSNGNPIVPEDFHVFVSTLLSPTYPGSDPSVTAWKADWMHVSTVIDNSATEWQTPDAWGGALAQHALIVCEKMSNDGRFLLNEIEVLRAADHDPTSTVVETAGDVVTQIVVSDFGWYSGKTSVAAFGPIGTHLVTTKGRVLDRLTELAYLVGGQVRITRDNSVVFERSPWHPLQTLPDSVASLTRSNGRLIRGQEGERNVVSQVQIVARDSETGETFRAQWPGVARDLGDVVEIERIIYGSVNEARYLAQLMFRQLNTQTEEIFVVVGHADGIELGDRVVLTWSRDQSGDQYQNRNFIVVGISMRWRHPHGQPKECEWTLRMREYIF